MSSDDDRRRYKRFEVAVEVEVEEEARSGSFQFISQNISAAGLLLISDIPFEEGTEYNFKLQLDYDTTVSLTGKIVWVRSITGKFAVGEPLECGVEFENISEKEREMIHEFLEKRSKG